VHCATLPVHCATLPVHCSVLCASPRGCNVHCIYLRCRQVYALQSGVTQRQVNMAFDKQELIELILASNAPDTAAVRLPALRSSSFSHTGRSPLSAECVSTYTKSNKHPQGLSQLSVLICLRVGSLERISSKCISNLQYR
jgi:hypothetical protein